MPLRGPPDGRYGGPESPGRPSRERVGPGKADTAPKAAPGFRAGPSRLAAFGRPAPRGRRADRGATPGPPAPPVVTRSPLARELGPPSAPSRAPGSPAGRLRLPP